MNFPLDLGCVSSKGTGWTYWIWFRCGTFCNGNSWVGKSYCVAIPCKIGSSLNIPRSLNTDRRHIQTFFFYIVATHLINFVEDQGTIEIRDLCVPNSKRLDDLDVGLPCPIFQRTIINDILSIFRNQHLMFQFHVFTRIRRNWDPIRRQCLSQVHIRTSDGVSVISVHFQLIVDDTGIEPVTPSMSRKCATAALIVRSANYTFSVNVQIPKLGGGDGI